MTGSVNSNSITAQTVASLLPKLDDVDPDYRFMSLNDLFAALTNAPRHDFLHNDYNTAARAVDGIIKSLDDQNGEVQNLAIKCLVPLVQRIPISILPPLIEKLTNLTTENSVDGTIPALALRSVIITLPRPTLGVAPSTQVEQAYDAISRVLIPRLVGEIVIPVQSKVKLPAPPPSMLRPSKNREVDAEGVDVLIEVVRCFGPLLQQPEIAGLQMIVQTILDDSRASSVVKKRAVVAISLLASYLTDDALSASISSLIQSFTNPHLSSVQRRLLITILASMAHSMPIRFGPYLNTLAPFVLSAVSQEELDDAADDASDDGSPDTELDDVRESALIAVDAFLSYCGSEMRPFTDEAIDAALRFLAYDPNYIGDDDDDEDMDDDDDDTGDLDDDEDFDIEAGFDDDDDDASWKVRRCAAKALYTLISTRGSGDLLEDGTLYTRIAPILISRFNEREQSVRLEVIATMALLIRKTGEGVVNAFSTNNVNIVNTPSRKRRRTSSSIASELPGSITQSAGFHSPMVVPIPSSGPKADLSRLTPSIIKVVSKELRGTLAPTKQAVVTLLQNMIQVMPGGLAQQFDRIVDPLVDTVKLANVATTGQASATGNTLRAASLNLISNIAKTHSSTILAPYLDKIVSAVVAASTDRHHKISSEAVATMEQLIQALTPPRSKGVANKQALLSLLNAILDCISTTEVDVEVRQQAIQALAILLARTARGDGETLLTADQRRQALATIEERLMNETTRLAAARAIAIAGPMLISTTYLDNEWVRRICIELSAQLRKADRALRGASLDALKALVINPAESRKSMLDSATVSSLAGTLYPLLVKDDLHLLSPALLVLHSLVVTNAGQVVNSDLVDSVCEILSAPLAGSLLDSLLTLVGGVGATGLGQPLMTKMLRDVSMVGDPAVTGKAIGTLLVSGEGSVGIELQNFKSELETSADEPRKILAITVLGEVSLLKGAKSGLTVDDFTKYFSSTYAKLPLAAAIALGRAGAGNPKGFLPYIISTMGQSNSASQYLLLNSIKEILQASGDSYDDEISTYANSIWEQLMTASQNDDNKAVGAECLGRLAILDPQTFVPMLQSHLVHTNPAIRALVIQAIRYTLPERDSHFDAILNAILLSMITTMMADADLENRRLALITLTSAANNKQDLILPHLAQLLPLVLQETVIRPELIKEVMMGPFKHKVDDGIDIRKSAYETMYSLMETSFAAIDIVQFYDRVIAGLGDEYDIRSLCNLMLTKLVILDVDETSNRLDDIAAAFKITLGTKLKESAVKQEIEKQDAAVMSALRVTVLLNDKIALGSQGWKDYWTWVEKDFADKIRSVQAEKEGTS